MTVYLPDDLADRVRAADLNVSAVLQNALREALAAHSLAAWLRTRPRPQQRPVQVEDGRGMEAVAKAREEFGA